MGREEKLIIEGNTQANDIAEVIGWDAVHALFKHFHGQDGVHVPRTVDDAWEVSRVIGIELARKLAVVWSGDRISFSGSPQSTKRKRELRELEAAIHAANLSTAEIARQFGVTPRWVRHLASDLGVKLPRSARPVVARRKAEYSPKPSGLEHPSIARIASRISEINKNGKSTRADIANDIGVSISTVDRIRKLMRIESNKC